jgi:hypothetical protein
MEGRKGRLPQGRSLTAECWRIGGGRASSEWRPRPIVQGGLHPSGADLRGMGFSSEGSRDTRQRRRRRAAEIRWVGGGLAGRELEDAPGGAQCCFSCAGARVTTGGRRCGGGGQAARFRSPLRIGVGCTSLAARLKSGPNLERWFAGRLFFWSGLKPEGCWGRNPRLRGSLKSEMNSKL